MLSEMTVTMSSEGNHMQRYITELPNIAIVQLVHIYKPITLTFTLVLVFHAWPIARPFSRMDWLVV